MFHLFLHFLIPMIVAKVFERPLTASLSNASFVKFPLWVIAWIIMCSTMLVDVDHLIATPIYEANRCSIGFHPLHTIFPIILYCIFCFIKKMRVIGVGLVIHMILDSIDCQVNSGVWFV